MLSLLRQRVVPATRVGLFGSARAFSVSSVASARLKSDLARSVPKGPATAYGRYLKDYFAREKDNFVIGDGKVDLSRIMTAVSDAWKALPESEKQPYYDSYKAEKKEFDEVYRSWYNGLSQEEIFELEMETGKSVKVPGGKKGFEKAEDQRMGKPDKPLTAFFHYMKEFRKTFDKSSVGARDVAIAMAKEGGERWKALSESEKQRYKDLANEAKQTWEQWHHDHDMDVPSRSNKK